MGQMGYDAVTLGNHEFDYKAAGLTAMLNRAAGKDMPPLVQANIDWKATLANEEQRRRRCPSCCHDEIRRF